MVDVTRGGLSALRHARNCGYKSFPNSFDNPPSTIEISHLNFAIKLYAHNHDGGHMRHY
jgi:hypothetical protein